ncbi:MAG: MarR family transcriptional regulator [bacterium]|nr:MarR family transcriptional regulator [bacterium]
MKEAYFEAIMRVEKLHRLFLEVVRVELDRLGIHDISNVQCFMLYNIGTSKLTVGEISNRGYYLGSNVTYNLKKLVESGYLIQQPSPHDKRSSHVCLSDKGTALYNRFSEILSKHAHNLPNNGISEAHVRELGALLRRLESFWSFVVAHKPEI